MQLASGPRVCLLGAHQLRLPHDIAPMLPVLVCQDLFHTKNRCSELAQLPGHLGLRNVVHLDDRGCAAHRRPDTTVVPTPDQLPDHPLQPRLFSRA
jgi:hypothetical protein